MWAEPMKSTNEKPEPHDVIANAGGRVKQASIKNIQIADDTDDAVRLQFGKVNDSTYSLDYAEPFSPVAAFVIALSSFLTRSRPSLV